MTRPRLLIIKTGSALKAVAARFGDFDAWFRRCLGPDRFEFDVRAVHEGDSLPARKQLSGYSGVLVTGSPAMVSHRHDWSEAAARWLAETSPTGLPMLGVCYGHQLIAHGLGGTVGPNPHGRRMGTSTLEVLSADDDLIGPLAPRAPLQVTHLEAVIEPPRGARVIGRAEGDPHHALHFGHRTWGVQFHPEFSADITASYVTARRALLQGEGIDSEAILENIVPTPAGGRVMNRFAEICHAFHGSTHVVGA